MINPNENDLTRDEPLPTQLQSGEEQIGSGGREQFRRASKKISTAMSQTWDETKEKAGRARERTEYFVRENPVPTILGALGLGIAIGLAIHYASTSEQKAEFEMEFAARKLELESSFPAFSLAVIQVSQRKI